MSSINEGHFLQSVIEFAWQEVLATFDIISPFVLKIQIICHSIAVIEDAIQAKSLKCSCSYSTGTLLGCTLQKISKVLMAVA